jgi:hypothetical protein
METPSSRTKSLNRTIGEHTGGSTKRSTYSKRIEKVKTAAKNNRPPEIILQEAPSSTKSQKPPRLPKFKIGDETQKDLDHLAAIVQSLKDARSKSTNNREDIKSHDFSTNSLESDNRYDRQNCFEACDIPIKSKPLIPFETILPNNYYELKPKITRKQKMLQEKMFKKYNSQIPSRDDSTLKKIRFSAPEMTKSISQYCLDKAFAVAASESSQFILKTSGIGPCVAVLFIGKGDPHMAALLHADIRTNPDTLQEIVEIFPEGATIHLYGGSSSPGSIETQRQLLESSVNLSDSNDRFTVGTCWLGEEISQRSMDFGYDAKKGELLTWLQ